MALDISPPRRRTMTLEEAGMVPDEWVSPEEAAWFLNVDDDTLRRARRRRIGPTFRRFGPVPVRYLAGSLPEWRGRLKPRTPRMAPSSPS
jgi:hypothetical protein